MLPTANPSRRLLEELAAALTGARAPRTAPHALGGHDGAVHA